MLFFLGFSRNEHTFSAYTVTNKFSFLRCMHSTETKKNFDRNQKNNKIKLQHKR